MSKEIKKEEFTDIVDGIITVKSTGGSYKIKTEEKEYILRNAVNGYIPLDTYIRQLKNIINKGTIANS